VVTPDLGVIDAWADAVLARHMRTLARPEFLKAVRALSARYVERRSDLPRRSPLDSAGKRAAFAGFYAPLHLYTVLTIASRLEIGASAGVTRIVDLGCGTGVSSAACALTFVHPPEVHGIDQLGWSLAEASWNWRTLGVHGRTRRGDLVEAAERLAARRAAGAGRVLVVLGWSVNELDRADRNRLLRALLSLSGGKVSVLVIEPVSNSATPWWREWRASWQPRGAREEHWSVETPLPSVLRGIDEAAGFRRHALTAKTLYVPG
jgi:hypothetical protein